MTAASADARTADRLGTLAGGDTLRALAALMVLSFHVFVAWSALSPAGAHLTHVLLPLAAGIYLFFPLSGYLVGGPWIRAYLGDGEAVDVARYANHRLLRIVPAFVIVWAVALAALGSLGADRADVAAVPAFAQVLRPAPGWGPLEQGWTLDVELMFYVALPVAGLLLARARAPRRALVVGGLAALAILSLALRVGPGAPTVAPGHRTLLTFWWAFCPGLLLAAVEVPARAWLSSHAGGLRIAGASAAASLAAFLGLVLFHGADGQVGSLVAYVVFGGGAVAAALVFQWTRGRAWAPLLWRPSQAVGRVSFAVYLAHIAIARPIFAHRPGSLHGHLLLAYLWLATLVATLAAASVLWRFVEAPILARRR